MTDNMNAEEVAGRLVTDAQEAQEDLRDTVFSPVNTSEDILYDAEADLHDALDRVKAALNSVEEAHYDLREVEGDRAWEFLHAEIPEIHAHRIEQLAAAGEPAGEVVIDGERYSVHYEHLGPVTQDSTDSVDDFDAETAADKL